MPDRSTHHPAHHPGRCLTRCDGATPPAPARTIPRTSSRWSATGSGRTHARTSSPAARIGATAAPAVVPVRQALPSGRAASGPFPWGLPSAWAAGSTRPAAPAPRLYSWHQGAKGPMGCALQSSRQRRRAAPAEAGWSGAGRAWAGRVGWVPGLGQRMDLGRGWGCDPHAALPQKKAEKPQTADARVGLGCGRSGPVRSWRGDGRISQ